MALVVLPFVVLCFYSHPSADDFCDAVLRQQFGFWVTQRDLYLHLTGRLFTSVLLTDANPLWLGGLDFYWLVPLLTLVLVLTSLYALLTAVAGPAWSAGTRALAAAVVLALWLLQNPSVAESVYWYNGLAVYTVPAAALLGWLAALVRYWLAATPRHRTRWLVLSLLLGTAVVWSNEIIGPPLLLVVGGLALWEWRRGGPRRGALTAAATWFAAALAVSLLAPGNAARAALIGASVPLPLLVLGPLGSSAYLLLNWASSGVLLAATLLALPALSRLVAAAPPALHRLASLRPAQMVGAAGAVLLLLPLAGLPSYWATGGLMPLRARASLYLLFLLGWFAGVLCGLVVARRTPWLRAVAAQPVWPQPAAALLWAWLLVNLATDHNLRVAHRDLGRASNSAVLAYRDWLSGSARRYDATLRARYRLLRTTPAQRLRVAALPLTARPVSLLYYDLTTDTTTSINEGYAQYFGKQAVWTGPGGQGRPAKTYQPTADDQ